MIFILMIFLIGCETKMIPFKVTFETNGGSSIDTIEVVKNSLLMEPSNPIRETYTFEGWYIDTEYTTPWIF